MLSTDEILDDLGLPHVDWLLETGGMFDIVSGERHAGFEWAEDNGIVLDPDDREHQIVVVNALHDAYVSGTSSAWYRRLKDIIEECFLSFSTEGIISVEVSFDDTRVVASIDLPLSLSRSRHWWYYYYDEEDNDRDSVQDAINQLPYMWDRREWWISNHHVDWEFDEETFVYSVRDQLEMIEEV